MIAEATTKLYDYEAVGRLRAGDSLDTSTICIKINTNLQPFSHRYYNPETGRFLSEEPTGIDGPNLYWYTRNNPINYVDPTGRESTKLLQITATALAVACLATVADKRLRELRIDQCEELNEDDERRKTCIKEAKDNTIYRNAIDVFFNPIPNPITPYSSSEENNEEQQL